MGKWGEKGRKHLFFGKKVGGDRAKPPPSNMKIISCVRFELDFRGQIFTRRRSIAGYVTDEGGNMDRKDFQR